MVWKWGDGVTDFGEQPQEAANKHFLQVPLILKEVTSGKEILPCLHSGAFSLTGPSRPCACWHII